MGRLGWVVINLRPIGLGNGPHVLGNGTHVLGNGLHVLGNGPHLCTQFMNWVILILIMGRLGWVVCLSWPYWVRQWDTCVRQ